MFEYQFLNKNLYSSAINFDSKKLKETKTKLVLFLGYQSFLIVIKI